MKSIASWGLSKEALESLRLYGEFYGKKWVYMVVGIYDESHVWHVARCPRYRYQYGQRYSLTEEQITALMETAKRREWREYDKIYER